MARTIAAPYLAWMVLIAAFALPSGASAEPVRIVALGDSNTAGFLVGRTRAFPNVLQSALRADGYDVQISNRGISGDTTGGMLARLDTDVPRGTRIAIVQGGYNDQRRGVPPEVTDSNVDAILGRLRARGVKVVLCGLSGTRWASMARRHGAIFVDGSTCYDARNRSFDGLHMNRAGHRVVAARLGPVIRRLVGRP